MATKATSKPTPGISPAAAKMAALEGFDKFGPNMYLYLPTAESMAQRDEAHPTLIVLCTFMGASPKIVSKYTSGYQRLFPHSSILVIMSNLRDTFASDHSQKRRTKLASSTILDVQASSAPGPILLHAMSNGGTTAAARIAQHLHDTGHPNNVFTHTVVDSAPSLPQLSNGVEATVMQFSIKSPWARWLAKRALYLWFGTLMFLWCGILRQEDIVSRLRRRWNEAKLFNPKCARLYLFSKNDKLIPFKDVHAHAADAKGKGWKDVREELFEKAQHCALIMEDPDRYWGAIERLVIGSKGT